MKRKALLHKFTLELHRKRKERIEQNREFALANKDNPYWRSKN